MTTVPTSIDHTLERPVAAARAKPLVALIAITALALAAASLTDGDLVAGSWVRAGLVATWALAALVLATRGSAPLGAVVARRRGGRGRVRRHRILRRPRRWFT